MNLAVSMDRGWQSAMNADALSTVLDIASIVVVVLALLVVVAAIFLPKDKRLAALKKVGRKLSSF